MKKLVISLLLVAITIVPMTGCRAVMVGSEAVWQAGTALIDPVDQDGFWEDWGDYLDSSSTAMRKNLRRIHRSFDRYVMLHDWDDPTY